MGGEHIGVDVPALVTVGTPVPIRVVAEAGDPTLPLQAVVMREDGAIAREPQLLDSDDQGGYNTEFSNLAPGIYRIQVESAVPQRPVEPVTDIALVWDSAVGA